LKKKNGDSVNNRLLLTAIVLSVISVTNSILTQEKTEKAEFPVLRGPYLGQKLPGKTPELFASGIVSTCNQHSSVYFSPDGKEVYFSRMLPGPPVVMVMKEENGVWTFPKILIQGLTPFLSPNGKKLYFSERSDDKANPSMLDIFVIERKQSGWTNPINLGPHVNTLKREDGPSVTLDGTLYLSSDTGNRQKSSNNIYRSQFHNGSYREREKLPETLNSPYTDGFPFIAPDESYLIFSSFRPGSYGMSDLYISFHKKDGTWTKPQNLGSSINSEAKEGFSYVTLDGKFLFFYSNRPSSLNKKKIPDGPGNVFWVDAGIINEMKLRIKDN